MKKILFIFVGFFLIFLFGILFFSKTHIHLVDSDEFFNLINSGDVFVVNTHTPYVGEINGTDLIAEDWENMASYIDILPKDKNVKVLVYCRSGHMSSVAAKELEEMGYNNIYDLEGGMNSWVASGRELINK